MESSRFPLPQDLNTPPELAEAVLRAVMNGCLIKDMPDLQPEHFTNDCDKAAWRALTEMEAEAIAGEFTSLVERLKRTNHPNLGAVDWPDYCTRIFRSPEYSSSLAYVDNAKKIVEYWGRRQEYLEAQQAAVRAADLSIPWAPDGGWQCDGVRGKTRWTVAELYATEFPEVHAVWDGVIPIGLTVFASRPKVGKSLLMLQLAGAVATGGALFGRKVEQGKVLYYALEDNGRRLEKRLRGLGVPGDAPIEMRNEIRPLHLGGLAEVKAAARRNKLVILDTITRAMPGLDLVRDAKVFGDVLGKLQAIALDHDMGNITVDHSRKKGDREPDPIEDVLGSTQLTAPADCVLAIYPEHGRAMLKGRARDMDDIELTMQLHTEPLLWELVGETDEISRTDKETEILEALRELGKTRASALAERLGEKRSNTSRRLNRLAERRIVAVETIDRVPYYFIADQPAEPQPPLLP